MSKWQCFFVLDRLWKKLRRLDARHLAPDILLTIASFYLSLWLRVGWVGELQTHTATLNKYIGLFILLRITTFILLGVYDIMWRFISLKDTLKLVRALLLSSLLITAATYIVDIGRIPRAIFFIELTLSCIFLTAIRFCRRLVREYESGQHVLKEGRRALLVGAGTTGRNFAARMETDYDAGLRVVGSIDDDPQKVGRFIAGTRVLGERSHLEKFIRDLEVSEVIITIVNPPPELLRDTVQACRRYRIRPRLMRSLQPRSRLEKVIDTFRDIELADLLNRSSKTIDVSALRPVLEGRSVLITGAGGTIGSELARQIIAFSPAKLLLLDHSEFNLYKIDLQLRGEAENPNVIPIMADVKDRHTLDRLFKTHKPEVVFHAAAYKHVHLVEANPLNAILNNVQGTRNLLNLALENHVSTFVQISTDKAVKPVGVMGLTKRVCELLVSQAGEDTGRHYLSVRFGNVLGSSGSLVPLLTKQIQKGEPITITHPDMTRYFMLVEEAVSLVLKAATLAQPGDICLLDMGRPVRIVDLAKSLYALLGPSDLEPPIVFTGQRPGEKLFEELYLEGNEIKTEDKDILIVPKGDRGGQLEFDLENSVGLMIQMAQDGNSGAVDLLRHLCCHSGINKDASAMFAAVPLIFDEASRISGNKPLPT